MRTWLREAITIIETATPETGWNGLLSDETTITKAGAVLDRMSSSVECETVWRMIERRHSEESDSDHLATMSLAPLLPLISGEINKLGGNGPYSFRELCVKHMNRTERLAPTPENGFSTFARCEAAAILAVDIASLLGASVPQETRAMRAGTLQQVEKAVSMLLDALPPVLSSMRYRDQQQFELSELAQFAGRRVDYMVQMHRQLTAAPYDDADVAVGKRCARDAAEAIEDLLPALRAETRRWALEPPDIAKPKHKNAARLHFIRGLTALFRMHYQQPFPDCVLAIAGTFFEIDDLDESAIYKLTKDNSSQ
jgi:hypothetical protein